MARYEVCVFDAEGNEAEWLTRDVSSIARGREYGDREIRGLDGWTYEVVEVTALGYRIPATDARGRA